MKNNAVLVTEMAKLLADSPAVLVDIKQFGDKLNITAGDLVQILMSFRRGDKSAYETFHDILAKWLEAENSGRLLHELLSVLKEIGHLGVVENISASFGDPDSKIVLEYVQSQTFWFGFQDSVPYFTGRSTEIEEINQATQKPGNTYTVISGEPGIGKRELVRKFAETYGNRYSAVIWLDCHDQMLGTAMRSQSLTIALNLPAEITNAKAAFESILRLYTGRPILFIFAGLKQWELDWIPISTKLSNTVTFLIIPEWISSNWKEPVQVIHLKYFSQEDSVLMIKSLVKDVQVSESVVQAFSEKMNGKPKRIYDAVEEAKNIDQQSPINLALYLQLLKQSEEFRLQLNLPEDNSIISKQRQEAIREMYQREEAEKRIEEGMVCRNYNKKKVFGLISVALTLMGFMVYLFADGKL